MAVNKRRIFLIPVLCVLVLCLAVGVLVIRPRFLYQQGVRELNSDNAAVAVGFFEQAEAAIPDFLSRSWVTAADRFHLYSDFGWALYQVGIQAWTDSGVSQVTFDWFVNAAECLKKAAAIEDGDYLTTFRRARTEHVLERLYPHIHSLSPNPHDAQALYQAAAALRPAGISVHQAWARYLFETGKPDQIPDLVRHLLSIYPPFYPSLKKEPYFSSELLPIAMQGLETAIQNGVRPRDAWYFLSRLSQDQQDPAGAIAYFETYLTQDPDANTVNDYIGMGTLYLTDGRYGESHDMFIQSLAKSDDPDASLSRIYRIFKDQEQGIRFLAFADVLDADTLKVAGLDLVRARCYLDLGQVFLAIQTLEKIIDDHPTGPACYLRAQIAAKEKDWEVMETFSQQATRLDPYNHTYHYLFARALFYRKKYEDAEFALTRAMRHADRVPAGYFHLRAWTRWHQKKFLAAAQDWDQAAALKPEHPEYADRAAQARQQQSLTPNIYD
ncbi:MAG: tetratricopeptide repeat protein [Desulfotignum sp.]